MRIVFMGSPEFAVPSLQKLVERQNVVGVYCQPDKPAGRGKRLKASTIKGLALQLNLPCFQPSKFLSEDSMQGLERLEPDLIVVAAYGKILPEAVLALPRFGAINVHASLLPRWRGAAPIHASILHGDKETGITIIKLVREMDAGDILSQRKTAIGETETSGALSKRLSEMGADLLLDTIEPYVSGEITPVPQDERLVTFAPMIKKAEGRLDFSQSVYKLERQVRAFNPWPSAFFLWEDRRIIVHKSHVAEDRSTEPGQVVEIGGFPAVSAMDGHLVLDRVQPAGKNGMEGDQFLRGSKAILDARIP